MLQVLNNFINNRFELKSRDCKSACIYESILRRFLDIIAPVYELTSLTRQHNNYSIINVIYLIEIKCCQPDTSIHRETRYKSIALHSVFAYSPVFVNTYCICPRMDGQA